MVGVRPRLRTWDMTRRIIFSWSRLRVIVVLCLVFEPILRRPSSGAVGEAYLAQTKIVLAIASQVQKPEAIPMVVERFGAMTLQTEPGKPRKKWSADGFFAADLANVLQKYWQLADAPPLDPSCSGATGKAACCSPPSTSGSAAARGTRRSTARRPSVFPLPPGASGTPFSCWISGTEPARANSAGPIRGDHLALLRSRRPFHLSVRKINLGGDPTS
jgi:hypothetical protein